MTASSTSARVAATMAHHVGQHFARRLDEVLGGHLADGVDGSGEGKGDLDAQTLGHLVGELEEAAAQAGHVHYGRSPGDGEDGGSDLPDGLVEVINGTVPRWR